VSILHVTQIAKRIKDLFEEIIPKGDLSTADQHYPIRILSRSLAAFAVYSQSSCSELEAANSVIDGTEDNGIDAIYFSPTSRILYLVQSKWMQDGAGEPSSADIGKFCNGVEDLINAEWDRFNDTANSKRAEVEAAIASFDAKVQLILIYSGSSALAKHGTQHLDDLLEKLNDASELVDFVPLNQAAIYKLLAGGIAGEPIELEFALSNWGRVEEPLEAYYGTISGEEVASWWQKYGDRLFEKNLRGVLGKTEVNQEIVKTIENRAQDFWYFNNGVTVTAAKVNKTLAGGSNRELGTFKAIDASVVNGAQTVSTIGRYAGSASNLAKVRVPLRIISLERSGDIDDYGASITRTNNTQNRIEARDFVTQDPEQSRLRQELALEGVTYSIVRSEGTKVGDNVIDLQEATVALACAKGEPSMAVLAKRNIGQFWADTKKAPYKAIFNPSTSSLFLNRAVIILREIDRVLVSLISSLPKRSGKRYGILVHGNRLIATVIFKVGVKKAFESASTFDLSTLDLQSTAVQVVDQMVSVIEANYADNFMATLFKNTEKCTQVFDQTISSLQGSGTQQNDLFLI